MGTKNGPQCSGVLLRGTGQSSKKARFRYFFTQGLQGVAHFHYTLQRQKITSKALTRSDAPGSGLTMLSGALNVALNPKP